MYGSPSQRWGAQWRFLGLHVQSPSQFCDSSHFLVYRIIRISHFEVFCIYHTYYVVFSSSCCFSVVLPHKFSPIFLPFFPFFQFSSFPTGNNKFWPYTNVTLSTSNVSPISEQIQSFSFCLFFSRICRFLSTSIIFPRFFSTFYAYRTLTYFSIFSVFFNFLLESSRTCRSRDTPMTSPLRLAD